MNERPDDLPDFTNPPVTEVVLGVQFNNLSGFQAPHLGLVWEKFRSNFPHIEEHPPIQPAFETFGSNPGMSLVMPLVLPPWMPRIFFVNDDRTQLLQVQRDRV